MTPERINADSSETDPQRTPAGPTGTPRWVKMFAIVGLVLVLLIVVMLLAGHGPGSRMRHTSPASAKTVGTSIWPS